MAKRNGSITRELMLTFVPGAVVILLWQWVGERSLAVHFFFSTPYDVMSAFVAGVLSGALVLDFVYTFVPTVGGFVVGVTAGTIVGFLLLTSRSVARAAEWNILLFGSIPIFAIAPMMIVWFGIGIEMKMAMALLSTFFVALSQAYRGGGSVPGELRQLFVSNGASASVLLRKLVFPMSLDWVFSSLRLNANLALLGVFVGEYMASEHGLGHAMLQAGALYRVSQVLAAALAMVILVVVIDQSVVALERRRHSVIQWLTVDPRLLRGPSS